MKKILVSLSFLFSFFISFSQGFPIYQPLGSANTRTSYLGAVQGVKGFINGVYPDTATANLGYIKYYPGAQIVTVDILWMRNYNATAWLNVGTTGGGSITIVQLTDSLMNYWRLTGNNVIPGASAGSWLGTRNNASLRFRTNNTQVAILDSNGRFGIGTNAPTQTFSLEENLWMYNSGGTQSVIRSAPGYNLRLMGGSNISLVPYAYGSTTRVDVVEDIVTNPGRVYFSYISGGASQIATHGIGLNNFYIKGIADSTDIRLKSKAPASVLIDSSRFALAKGQNVVAANNLTLGYDGNLFTVTGTTQVNAITTYAWQAGSIVYIRTSSTPTFKHNTSGGAGTAKMMLAGNADFVSAAGDLLVLQYDGTDWKEIGRSVAAISPIQRFGKPGEDVRDAIDARYFSSAHRNFRIDSTGFLQWHTRFGLSFTRGGNSAGSGYTEQIQIGSDLIEMYAQTGGNTGDVQVSSTLIDLRSYSGTVSTGVSVSNASKYVRSEATNISNGNSSLFILHSDSTSLKPNAGLYNIDTLGSTHGSDTTRFKPMVHNPTTGQVKRMTYWPALGGSSSVTADNGLTAIGSNVQLGGTLLANTTIATTAAFGLTISGDVPQSSSNGTLIATNNHNQGVAVWASTTGSSGIAINASSQFSYGVFATTVDGTGLSAQATGTGIGLYALSQAGTVAARFQTLASSTNTVIPVIEIKRGTSGTAGSGIGSSIDFITQTSTSEAISNQITSKFTTVTHASRVSQMEFWGVNAATLARKASLAGSGQWAYDAYGAGTFTGTPTFLLAVDASGNVIETSTSGGGVAEPATQVVYGTGAGVDSDPNFTYNNATDQVGIIGSMDILQAATNATAIHIQVGGSTKALAWDAGGSAAGQLGDLGGAYGLQTLNTSLYLKGLSGDIILQTDVASNSVFMKPGVVLTTTFDDVETISEVFIRMKEQSAPSAPASGYASVYPKSDGLWYGKDDAGVEVKLSNDPASGYTFNNGLTLTGSTVTLGGTLLTNTVLATVANTLTISTSTAATTPLAVTSTTGNTMEVNATSGVALRAIVTGANEAGTFIKNQTTTNAIQSVLSLSSQVSSGNGAVGNGAALNYYAEIADGSTPNIARVIGVVSDATAGTYSGKLEFHTVNSSSNALRLTIDNLGSVINTGRLQKRQGNDVASVAGAISLGTDGNVFEITGTNAVTLISNLNWQNGSEITLVFTTTATLTDGTANSGTDIGMELAGGTNFSASADDLVTLVLTEMGGTQRWREKSRSVN